MYRWPNDSSYMKIILHPCIMTSIAIPAFAKILENQKGVESGGVMSYEAVAIISGVSEAVD